MNRTLYSIGYTAFNIEQFLNILKKYQITSLIDVRSMPYSKHYSDYNKDFLSKVLKDNKILYRNYKDEFGARQANKNFYSNDGYLNFDIFAKSNQFLYGVEKIIAGLKLNQNFVFMCAEKDPLECHRSILVGHQFSLRGFNVLHILDYNEIISQDEIDKILVDKYFPNRDQISFFDQGNSYYNYIGNAYKKKNLEIGFKAQEE
jgi:uncharacterized protein (DUF488 family)